MDRHEFLKEEEKRIRREYDEARAEAVQFVMGSIIDGMEDGGHEYSTDAVLKGAEYLVSKMVYNDFEDLAVFNALKKKSREWDELRVTMQRYT